MIRIYKRLMQINKARLNENSKLSFPGLIWRITLWILFYDRSLMAFQMLRFHHSENRFSHYVTNRTFHRVNNKLNPAFYRSLLEDKYVFDRIMSSFGFPLAEMLATISNNEVFFMKSLKKIPLEELATHEIDAFCKMFTKWGGSAVHKLTIASGHIEINNQQSNMDKLASMTRNSFYVLQQGVSQHHEMNRLNDTSVNTIRVISLHNGQRAEISGCFIRMGKKGSLVDNINMGGIACGIGEGGRLYKHAIDSNHDSIYIDRHPTSHTLFSDIVIPYYEDAKKLALKMHECFHCFFSIAWDIAITETGPVVIEGNPLAGIQMEQAIYPGVGQKFLATSKEYSTKREYLL